MAQNQKKFGLIFWIASIYILAMIFIAIFSHILSPDATPNANRIHVSLALKKIGFEVDMIQIKNDTNLNNQSNIFTGINDPCIYIPINKYRELPDSIIYEEYMEDGVKGNEVSIEKSKLYISKNNQYISHFTYPLGTDRYGRDLLSRLMVGTGVSLAVGFIAVIISLILGLLLGLIAGYYKGWVDTVVSWLINVIWSLPTLLIVIAITLALGKGFWQIFIAVGFTMWVEVARLVRGQVLSIREKEYITAARTLGASNARIIFKHILPNLTGPLIVMCSANFASAILLEAGLSFLGIGIQPPQPSWGQILRDHSGYIVLDKAWLAIAPGLCIMMLVVAFNMLGNALRDKLDIR